jgi:hypothetical protein
MCRHGGIAPRFLYSVHPRARWSKLLHTQRPHRNEHTYTRYINDRQPTPKTFFFSMALPAHSRPRPLIQFRNHFSQTVELLGRVISPSQARYVNTATRTQNKLIHTPNINSLSGIRTHDPRVRASEGSACRAATVTRLPKTYTAWILTHRNSQ